jgi:iron(III) transport system substrate-binding protein
MKKFSRRFFLSAGTATIAIASSNLVKNRRSLSASGEVNIYSSRHYNTDEQLYAGFTQQTGIEVNLIEGKDDELIERVKSEGANSPADVLLTVDAGRLWRAEEAGLFAPVSSQLLTTKIPASLRHPENLWFGFSKRARVIMYNKNTVNPSELSTYENLADPKWQGRILMRSSSNVYNQSLVASLIAALGEQPTEQWCKGLVANLATPPEGTDTSNIEAVAAGQGDLTIANTYYLARYGKDKSSSKQAIFEQIGVFFPNQSDRGTHVNISGGGLMKAAPNQANAIAFLEYLVSSKAQEFFALGNNEYPVVAGVPIDSVVAGFGTFKADTTNVSAYGTNNAMAVQIMDRSGWK